MTWSTWLYDMLMAKEVLFVLILSVLLYLIFLQPANKRRGARDERPKVLGGAAGVYCVQGRRSHMEDTYHFEEKYNGQTGQYFYAVYDGHGGARCSEFCERTLHQLITTEMGSAKKPTEEHVRNAFRNLDEQWLRKAHRNNFDDGSTAVMCILTKDELLVAHVGDSRAVLHSGKVTVDLTNDHKPDRPDERLRIEALGGRVQFFGTWRVEGVLAVSRAIGDRRLKRYVSAVPEVSIHSLTAESRFLILASDGLWDVFTAQDAVALIADETNMKVAAQKLGVSAMEKGSGDNITVLVVDLHHLLEGREKQW